LPYAWPPARRSAVDWHQTGAKRIVKLDDELCLCFHVSKRKVINWVRVTKPRRPSQLSECYGAGTGCGWCRPFLERIYRELQLGEIPQVPEPTSDEYRRSRSKYVRAGGGTPPAGATPIDPEPDEHG
jgi:NAD(P)H-nitrite reductase large subunit